MKLLDIFVEDEKGKTSATQVWYSAFCLSVISAFWYVLIVHQYDFEKACWAAAPFVAPKAIREVVRLIVALKSGRG